MERELIGLCKADLLSLRAKLQQYIGQLYPDMPDQTLGNYIRTAVDEIYPTTSVAPTNGGPAPDLGEPFSVPPEADSDQSQPTVKQEPVEQSGVPLPPNTDVLLDETSGLPETSSFASIYDDVLIDPSTLAALPGRDQKQERPSFNNSSASEHQQIESAILAESVPEFAATADEFPDTSDYAMENEPNSPSCSTDAGSSTQQRKRSRPLKRAHSGGGTYTQEISYTPAYKPADATATSLVDRAHRTISNGVVQWHCPVQGCQKVFKGNFAKHGLCRHIRVIHTGSAKVFSCPYCPYRTTVTTNMRGHLKRQHSASAAGRRRAEQNRWNPKN